MTPNQQIIPGPRASELRPAGRPSSIEISRPTNANNRPQPEATVKYAALLRRHRNAVTLIVGGMLLLAVLYTLVAPKTYKSDAILEVMGTNQDFMNNKELDPSGNQVTGDEFIETQTKLIKSPPVVQRTAQLVGPKAAGAMASSPGVIGTVRGWFGTPAATPAEGEQEVLDMLNDAKVKVDGASDLITLTMYGPEPNLTADAANTLTQQFIEHAQDVRMDSAGNTNKFLISELADARKKLQTSEDDLQNYARQTGIVIPSESQESVAADKLRQIQSDLVKAENDEASTKAEEETSHSNPADALPQVLDDPTLRDDRARLADLRRQLSDLSVTLTPANYKIQQLNAQIADLEQQSAKHRANIVKRLGVQNNETTRRKQLLAQAYNAQLGVVSDQSAKEVRYNILKKEVDANRDVYQSMMQRVKQAGIMAALKSSDVRVVSPAQPAKTAYQPNLLLNLAVGLLSGLVFSTCYILFLERNDASLRTPGQSVKHLNVPELAVIPSARIGNSERIPLTLRNLNGANGPDAKNGLVTGKSAIVDKEMVQWCQDETMMADAYRSAITSILLTRINGISPRVILITSPRPKAGKTTTVANLGISLAEIGRRVLLIDGDLRRPRLGKLFGLQFATGLSDALLDEGSGKITLDSVVRPSSVPGLYVLPGGSEPANISKLLHSTYLDSLIELARSEYDFVLLDSPPMMGMADARLLSRNVDGVILISRAGETSPEQLGEAKERLADDGTPVIGTILNGCDLRTEDPAYVNHYNSYAGVSRD